MKILTSRADSAFIRSGYISILSNRTSFTFSQTSNSSEIALGTRGTRVSLNLKCAMTNLPDTFVNDFEIGGTAKI